ncbi:MAG TPA: hypothetical protein VF783_26590, partial [Terriglobales bacterium]
INSVVTSTKYYIALWRGAGRTVPFLPAVGHGRRYRWRQAPSACHQPHTAVLEQPESSPTVPDAIKPYYGNHALGVSVYLRVRLR